MKQRYGTKTQRNKEQRNKETKKDECVRVRLCEGKKRKE